MDCRAAYDLSNPTNEWSCGGSGFRLDESESAKKNLAEGKLVLFPNPANESINIQSVSEITAVYIYDSSGQLIKSRTQIQATAEKTEYIKFTTRVIFC